MNASTRSIRRLVGGGLAALGLASTVLVAVPTTALAAANFTATIAPLTTTAGHSDAYTVTVHNTGLQVISSVTVTPATGFTVTGGSTSSGAFLAVGGTETIQFTATAPTTPQTATWTVSANSVIGSAGSVTKQTTVTAAPATQLVFGQQPSNTTVNTAIAPAVTVIAEDQYGNVDSSYGAAVSLAYGAHPASAGALTGNVATPSGGVASFPSLKVPTQGAGYTLVASSGTLSPATSSAFTVDGSVVACPAGQTCTSGNVSDNGVGGNGITSTVNVTGNAGSQSDVLVTDVGVLGAMKCTTLGATASTSIATRSKSITYTLQTQNIEGSPADENSGIDVSDLKQICYGSNQDFKTSSGPMASASGPGNVYPYEGTLPNCNHNTQPTTTNMPCVHSMVRSPIDGHSLDKLTAVIWAAAGDPGVGAR